MLELALFAPWVFFLFIGALDAGVYAYCLVSMQAAARSAVLYTSSGSTLAANNDVACNIVLGEMHSVPGVGSTTSCASNPYVRAASVTGPDSAAASQVTVRFTSPVLIPVPGLLTNQFTITRTAKMRIRT